MTGVTNLVVKLLGLHEAFELLLRIKLEASHLHGSSSTTELYNPGLKLTNF